MDRGCPCCGRPVAAAWLLTVEPLRLYREWRPDGERERTEHRLCETCSKWMGGLVAGARGEGSAASMFGSPSSGGRRLVFDDQCQVCCGMPAERAARIAWVSPSGARLEVFACPACEAWLVSLASDGRTLRGAGDREIDGPYGAWPHPNLKGTRVWLGIEDATARAVARETCESMGIVLAPGEADVAVIEATVRGNAARSLRGGHGGRRGTVILAGLRERRDLANALEAGASCWMTLPSTPQQLTAGIVVALRSRGGMVWERSTCLPFADAGTVDRPVIAFTPAEKADPFEVAWLLRRFARGYDTVEWLAGKILVGPRADREQAAQVAARLQLLLRGRATAAVLEARDLPGRVRFEAAG